MAGYTNNTSLGQSYQNPMSSKTSLFKVNFNQFQFSQCTKLSRPNFNPTQSAKPTIARPQYPRYNMHIHCNNYEYPLEQPLCRPTIPTVTTDTQAGEQLLRDAHCQARAQAFPTDRCGNMTFS